MEARNRNCSATAVGTEGGNDVQSKRTASDNFAETYLHYAHRPHLFVMLFAGPALLLADVVLQQVLENPVADLRMLGLLPGTEFAIPPTALLAPSMAGWCFKLAAISEVAGLAISLVSLVMLPHFRRSQQILPLGDPGSSELGLAPQRSRLSRLSRTAVLTVTANLIVGTLSFVELVAFQIAAMTTPLKQRNRAVGAAAIGAALMTVDGWPGRSKHGPNFLWVRYRRQL